LRGQTKSQELVNAFVRLWDEKDMKWQHCLTPHAYGDLQELKCYLPPNFEEQVASIHKRSK